jgi:hypothetical protein
MERKGQENVDEPAVTENAPAEKRPYTTPRLRRLGSVRELTLGATMGGFSDGGGGKMTTPM